MTRLALRGLLARKLRTALTGFAVVIGVAFVAGTFVFTDTIDESFKDLFERVSKGVDVSVTAKKAVDAEFGGRPQPLPPGTLEKVRATDGVAAADANLEAAVAIFDEDGDRIGGQTGPSLLFSSSEERFDPLTYEEGEPATEPGTTTIDQKTAEDHGFAVGDEILVAGREPAEELRDRRHHQARRPEVDRPGHARPCRCPRCSASPASPATSRTSPPRRTTASRPSS